MAMCHVRYEPVVHDGDATYEQRMLLLAKAGERVWRLWIGSDGAEPVLQGVSEEFNTAMRLLYRELQDTDIFMSGVHNGEKR